MANREIQVNITADVSGLNNGINKANDSVNNLGNNGSKQTNMLGGLFGKLGGVIAGAFSVGAIVNFGKEVFNVGKEFEYAMSRVQATSGASAEELQKLTETARDMASKTMYSSRETAEALNYMALAGWDATQMMDGLAGVLNLATAGAMDLQSASDIVTDVLTMFSMEAEEAGRMVDVLAVAQARSNTTVEMLGDALKYCGGAANTFGMDIEQTTAALGIMANAGIKSSMAGRSLKNILTRLASPTKQAAEGLEMVGLSAEKLSEDGKLRDLDDILIDIKKGMEGLTEAQRVQAAKFIAGSEAMSGFLAIVNQADGDLQGLQDQLYNSAGAGQEMADIMSNTLEGATKRLGSAWEELKLKLYDMSEGAFKTVTSGLADIVTGINSLWSTGLEFSNGFTDGISYATRSAVEGFKNTYREVSVLADTLRYTGGEVTQQFAQDMAINLSNWSDETNALLQKTYDEDLAILHNYFESANISDEEHKANLLNKLNEYYNNVATANQTAWDRINEIVQGAYDRQTGITEEEQAEIERLINESNERILSAAATSVDEELALLEALSEDKDRITSASAEKVYQNAKNQKEKVISEAQALRDEEIKQAYRLKNMGIITEEEYNSMVTTAKDKYGEMETTATNKFNEIARNVEQAAIDLGASFDRETGKVKKGWEALVLEMERKRAKYYHDQTITTVLTEKDNRKVTKGMNIGVFSGSSSNKGMGGTEKLSLGYSAYSVSPVSIATRDDDSMGGASYSGGVTVSVGNMTVRNDSDINRIAEQIYRLQQRNARGKGVFRNV